MTQTDWLPRRREAQIALSEDWQTILVAAKVSAWSIPTTEVTALKNLTTAAKAALALAQSSSRTIVVTAQYKAAFAALTEKMRFFKNRYFVSPPLIDADYLSLQLKPKDTTRTPVPPPAAMAEADISYPHIHQLELHLHPTAESPVAPHHADYGHRIYFGILPIGGASVEAALSNKRELVKPPASGEDLPHSIFTRRKRERFDFAEEERGKTIYFCVRFENAKGESGQWGPIFSALIP
jgi:hypothetical protein